MKREVILGLRPRLGLRPKVAWGLRPTIAWGLRPKIAWGLRPKTQTQSNAEAPWHHT